MGSVGSNERQPVAKTEQEILQEKIADAQSKYPEEFNWRYNANSIVDDNFRNQYRSVEELMDDGWRGTHDFSVSTLLYGKDIMVRDFDPVKSVTKVYQWDEDWHRWQEIAEKRWK